MVSKWVTAGGISELYTFKDQETKRTLLLALILYNIIVNIAQEIEYMWFKPFSLPTFLYILTRYIPFIAQGVFLSANCLINVLVSCVFLRISIKLLIFPSHYGKTRLSLP